MSHATAVQDRPTPPTGPAPRSGLSSPRCPAWHRRLRRPVALAIGISLAAGWHSKVQWG
ncbi:hypothetical protein SALBM217S_07477 [Streptomyces griseoloalbus]